MTKKRAIAIVLCLIVIVLVIVFGTLLYLDPYLLAGNQETESANIWSNGAKLQALVLFNFSSRGLITANYPVTVTADIQVANQTLLSFLREKQFVELDIAGTYSSPIHYGLLGIYEGSIALQFDGTNNFKGNSNIIFPYTGSSYYFSIFAYDANSETSPPIYTMNVTDIAHAIPPTFSIDEGYSARLSFEQANQNTGLTIIIIGLTGVALIGGIQIGRQKKDKYKFDKITKELTKTKEELTKTRKELNEIKKQISNQNQNNPFKQKS